MSVAAVGASKHAVTVDHHAYVIQSRAVAINQRWDAVYRITKNGQTAKAWTKAQTAGLSDPEAACQAGIEEGRSEIDQGLIAIPG